MIFVLGKKYFAATKTTNPYLNDPDNTVYHKENESEHSKNSENCIKITHIRLTKTNLFYN